MPESAARPWSTALPRSSVPTFRSRPPSPCPPRFPRRRRSPTRFSSLWWPPASHPAPTSLRTFLSPTSSPARTGAHAHRGTSATARPPPRVGGHAAHLRPSRLRPPSHGVRPSPPPQHRRLPARPNRRGLRVRSRSFGRAGHGVCVGVRAGPQPAATTRPGIGTRVRRSDCSVNLSRERPQPPAPTSRPRASGRTRTTWCRGSSPVPTREPRPVGADSTRSLTSR